MNHLESISAEHGIPSQLVTDTGSQYSSKEFKYFPESCGIEHLTSFHRYPKTKGSSKCMVKTVFLILHHDPGFLIGMNLHKLLPFSFDFGGHLPPVRLMLRDKLSCKGETVASSCSGSKPAIQRPGNQEPS